MPTYINHEQQRGARPLTARELGGPEEGDILTDGTDPTALFSRAFADALERNQASYKKNPVMTRRNTDALEAARSEGFIDQDPLAGQAKRRAQEDKLAIEEARNYGRLGVADINAGARRYAADATRDVGSGNAAARQGSSRVQGLMRQLDTLKSQRGELKPAEEAVEGEGLRGFLGFGKAAKPARKNDQSQIDYLDKSVGALEHQLTESPQEYTWDEVMEHAREHNMDPAEVQRQLEGRGHAVYR